MRVRLKKSGRGSSSSGSSGMNRSADVGNIICLTVCVLGLKKRGGSRGVKGAQAPLQAPFKPPFKPRLEAP